MDLKNPTTKTLSSCFNAYFFGCVFLLTSFNTENSNHLTQTFIGSLVIVYGTYLLYNFYLIMDGTSRFLAQMMAFTCLAFLLSNIGTAFSIAAFSFPSDSFIFFFQILLIALGYKITDELNLPQKKFWLLTSVAFTINYLFLLLFPDFRLDVPTLYRLLELSTEPLISALLTCSLGLQAMIIFLFLISTHTTAAAIKNKK